MDVRRLIRKKWFWAVVVLVLMAGRTFVLREQTRIRRCLGTALAGVENARVDQVLSVISTRYHDRWGSTREDLQSLARTAFSTVADIRIHIQDESIRVDGDHAEMDLRYRVVGTINGMRGWILGTMQDPLDATIVFTRESGGWKIIEIRQKHRFY